MRVMDIGARRRAGARLALAVAGFTLAFGLGSAQAAFPGANGRLAFAVERWRLPDPCRRDIPHGCEPQAYSSSIDTVQPSGAGRRVLRDLPVGTGAGPPVWSPSGRLLTFQQGSRLAIMRGDGTGLRRLRQLTSRDEAPTWSPDGRRLAFIGGGGIHNWLYTVRRDATGLRRVLGQEALAPAWSVTGTIAFVNSTGRRPPHSRLEAGLYTIRPDRSHLRRLFGRLGGPDPRPDWSPDGSRIAFAPKRHIWTMWADGSGLRRLTVPTGERTSNTAPAWSPDGRYIAFIRDGDLYVMRSNGRGLRRLVDAPKQDPAHPDRPWAVLSAPSWQPLPR
jgi:Tol biopolymer transport system component